MSFRRPTKIAALLALSLSAFMVFGTWTASVGRMSVPAGPRGTITISLSADPPTLDPAYSSSLYDRQVLNNICDKLFDLNSKGKIIDDLVTHTTLSKNQKVYTFTIRKGVKFTDGSSLTATAVKFNLDRDRKPSSTRASELSFVKSVKVLGRYSLRVTLTQPFAPFISILTDRSGMIVSPKAVKAEGDQTFRNHPVCSGPFMYQSRVKGDSIMLVANPHYWRKGEPKVKKLIYKIFTDPITAAVNLQSGQVDMTDAVPATMLKSIQSNNKLTVVNKSGYGYNGIYLNVKAAPLNNVNVRRAIYWGIDRKKMTQVVFGKTAHPGNSPFAPGDLAHDATDKVPARNVKLAKQYLAKSHLSSVSFSLLIASGDPIGAQLAQIVQSELKQIGITVTIQPEDFGTLLNTTEVTFNYQAAALGWSGRPDPDQNIYSFFYTKAALNSSQYSNPTVDKLLNEARATSKASKRKALYDKTMKILDSQVPYVFIYHQDNVFGMSRSLSGFTYVPDGMIRVASMSIK